MKLTRLMSVMAIAAPLGSFASAQSHGAHVHGEADLSVVVDGDKISITLFSAMYNIVGFERAPGTDAERAELDEARTFLGDGALLFSFDVSAGCVSMASAHNIPTADAHDHDEANSGEREHGGHGHRDLEADYSFECANPSRLTRMDTKLLAAFPRLEKVKAVVLNGNNQSSAVLTSETDLLSMQG